jgi:pyruvate,water dikinase
MALFKLNEDLPKLLGKEDANALLSNLRGHSDLESLGPVTGTSKIIKEEMSREDYLLKYGHRGPHEFELSIAEPSENERWLDAQFEEFKKSDTDADELLEKQHIQFEKAFKKLKEQHPEKEKMIGKQIADAADGSQLRETVRSEWTRVFRVNRSFARKVAKLTGIGDDVFFLYMNEVLDLLSGETSAMKHIPARHRNYELYKTLSILLPLSYPRAFSFLPRAGRG